jgi:hypothetical protein
MNSAVTITVLFLMVVSLPHFLRVLLAIEITVNDLTIPVWISVMVCLGPGVLAILLWREQRASLERPT